MKLLALETATDACSAAILIDDQVIERYQRAPRGHADLILPMLDGVLAETGLSLGQLDALAVGRGPGAFTGVRIAIAVAQGIAFAADLPVAPISTLAAIAWEVNQHQGVDRIAVALDARLEEVYWGTYRATADGGMQLVGQERVCRPEQTILPDTGEWVGAGSGWALYAECLSRPTLRTWWSDYSPSATAVARLGALAYRRGETVEADRVLPVYLRDEVVKPRGC
ncbi:MAG TPA: tRNA (adenosine(37)-N6)-threonylcarbamoyltransferase complex dimerization subunit type 1 TsaB [Candidatus Competibacteraceae bacterium]|nr:tRNA (adenosine(37)-N6)-threonylcarbamoyltransferase complex dimerization subunit type 1 TsaB [Candidatus Competibacteraceae bacterium]